MIRGLFLLLLFMVGLATAAIFQGRMHHLRQGLQDQLPGWSTAVAADAGLRRGTAALPARGRWPAMRLQWTARLPTRDGWIWDLMLDGEGVVLAGRLTVGFRADRAVVSDVSGSADLGVLLDNPVPVQGILRIEALSAVVSPLWESPVITGAVQGRVAGLRLEDADFGAGPLTGALDDTGAWRAKAALSGGVSEIEASLAGVIQGSLAQLQIAFSDSAALPPQMRAMLAAAGQVDGQGSRLSLPVPVP